MVDLMAFSAREIGNRERQEDYAVHEYIKTPNGLHLQLAIVCDGAGGGESGEMAARLTARSAIDHIEISDQTNIPRLLMEAVESANELVYSELRGEGTSTIVMIAVDLNDPTAEFGRLYAASVGDSYVCLIRDGQLVRLNIDHILANEYIYAGQMSVAEARRLDNAQYPTRVIGVNPEIQVDIGLYSEKGNNFVNSRRAFNIGKTGMILQEGDTVLVASDGIFRIGQGNRHPYVRKEELLRHAMDDDAERAVRAILRYAAARRPDDNLCLSMLMVPSRLRRPIRASAEVPLQQRILLGAIAAILIIVAIFLFLQFATQLVQPPEGPPPERSQGIVALAATPTRVSFEQIGIQYFAEPNSNDALSVPLFTERSFSYNNLNYLLIDGENIQALVPEFLPANVFMQPGSTSEITVANNQPPENIEMLIYPESDLFINTGAFSTGGVRIQYQPDDRFIFNTRRTECAAVEHNVSLPDSDIGETLVFTCFTGDSNSCNFRAPGRQPIQMEIGKQYIVDIDSQALIDTVDPDYEKLKIYYDTVVTLQGSPLAATCLVPYLDVDGDGVGYPNDACPREVGLAGNQGCPAGVSPTTEAGSD